VVVLSMTCLSPLAAFPEQRTQDRQSDTVRIGVFSLFHPKELVLRGVREPDGGPDLTIEIGGHSQVLTPEASVRLRVGDGQVELQSQGMNLHGVNVHAHAAGMSGMPFAYFVLEAPGKLRRVYFGTLEVRVHQGTLEAIVTMPLETAVASVVAAESPPGAGIEALKAQAVAARSFLVARHAGHAGFDFCDTTHCQFLRSPPSRNSEASRAARETAGMVLTWRDAESLREQVLPAMYARSCGGRTRTLREIGVAGKGYPYYAVHCVYCSRHPETWRRDAAIVRQGDLPTGDLATKARPLTERERLAFNRIHGWGAIPSLAGEAEGGTQSSITGRGIGHGVGLCQRGAADMARRGSGFTAILAHYYPNTRLAEMPLP
jgi:stage II sporulation protein D